VDDAATRELLVRVYAHLRQGTGRAEALRVAQRAFVSGAAAAAGWSHPAFWAAFALVGDWRPLQLRHD
jgi:CHAT domain-containing protein